MKSDRIFPDISEMNRAFGRVTLGALGLRQEHTMLPDTLISADPPAHKLNADQTVAVATDVFWNEDMATAPRGTKCQLLSAGGVATYGVYNGDPFWQAWAPLPKRRRKV